MRTGRNGEEKRTLAAGPCLEQTRQEDRTGARRRGWANYFFFGAAFFGAAFLVGAAEENALSGRPLIASFGSSTERVSM